LDQNPDLSRSYIDECLDGIRKLMESDFTGPVNIGSEEMVAISQLAEMTMKIAGKKLSVKHIPGPVGVRGRNSDNRPIAEELSWKPSQPLEAGLKQTYRWIERMVSESRTIQKTFCQVKD